MRRHQPGWRHFQQRTEGMSAVEFALVLPVLLWIVCGIMDFGNIFFQTNIVNEAARDAARRYAVTKPAPSKETVQSDLRAAYDPGNKHSLTVKPWSVSGTPPAVTATVEGSVNILTPKIATIIPSPFKVKGVSIMRVE